MFSARFTQNYSSYLGIQTLHKNVWHEWLAIKKSSDSARTFQMNLGNVCISTFCLFILFMLHNIKKSHVAFKVHRISYEKCSMFVALRFYSPRFPSIIKKKSPKFRKCIILYKSPKQIKQNEKEMVYLNGTYIFCYWNHV